MATEVLLLAILFATLSAYLLLGGADFGAGVWDLFARGPRKTAQRDLIEHAIGPVWEANHVWLIFAVVVLFSGFPRAFAALSVAFYAPLTLLLLGIVFRGSAFAFRHALADQPAPRKRWGLVFSLASIASPFLLGTVVGGAASESGDWTRPFALCVGALTLSLCAALAAIYLVNETGDPALQRDFIVRAYVAAVAAAGFAIAAFLTARGASPHLYAGLARRPESAVMVALTAALAAFGIAWLRKKPRLARALWSIAVLLLLSGWAVAQYPYLKVPDLTIWSSAGSPQAQKVILIALGIGAAFLAPSLYVLFRVFKKGQL